MLIYIAAAFQRQAEMRRIREELRLMGHAVTSRWLDQESNYLFGWTVADIEKGLFEVQEQARRDIEDLTKAQAVFSFTDGDLARGGRHTEFGMAIVLGKRLWLIGPREHIFHSLGRVAHYPSWQDLAREMETWTIDMRELVEGG
jgi:hypothetical protein